LKKNLTDKLKTCCFYNDNNRRYDSIGTKLKNKVRESDLEGLPDHLLEQSSNFDFTRNQKVPEQYSTNYNEFSRVKNIFKIGTPLPLEPSQPSHIHTFYGKRRS
jgi:hypothetical protein